MSHFLKESDFWGEVGAAAPWDEHPEFTPKIGSVLLCDIVKVFTQKEGI